MSRPVENALFWLLKDSLEYARLKTFGGYLNDHGGLDMVHNEEIKNHIEITEGKVLRSAISYLHSLTALEQPHDRIKHSEDSAP